jgi:hypothetical protein
MCSWHEHGQPATSAALQFRLDVNWDMRCWYMLAYDTFGLQ